MKSRTISWIMALCLLTLVIVPVGGTWAEDVEEEELILFVPEKETVLERGEGDNADEESVLEDMSQSNANIFESLGKTDWEALAAAAKKTGDWREDLIEVAQSQLGYTEDADGMTIYTIWAEYEEPQEWTALFVSWVAAQAGLTEKQFPREDSYEAFCTRMDKLNALRRISRSSYPMPGDLALIEKDNQQMIGVVVYVSNGIASIIHGDDNGAVTTETYVIGDYEFNRYIDLNVLMERVGIEVGKGGKVPEIPEGGVAAWTNTNAVYMRTEPTTASKRVTTVKNTGTALLVTSGAMQDDGYIWYAVEYGQHAGYIRGDLLTLDMASIPTATPEPTAAPEPTATPEPTAAPGCITCANEAGNIALPEVCCYEHLRSMDTEEAYRFMSSLLESDPLMFTVYVDCHNAHVLEGAPAVICHADCEQSIFSPVAPGAAHSVQCPWHKDGGLSVQERVVNIVVTQPAGVDGVMPGQKATFTFEVYGAAAYQWFQVETQTQIVGGVTTTKEVTTLLAGETGTTLTVVASEENAGLSYFCEATLPAGDAFSVVSSKRVRMDVAALIKAQAILGEEVNFTYNYEGAAAYQWYAQSADQTEYEAISGAVDATLSLMAEEAASGLQYYCVALDSAGAKLAQSNCYTYEIPVYETYTVNSCDSHDLCMYVNELANMTRAERYAIMTGAWDVTRGDTTLAALVHVHWEARHKDVYPTLLCTCEEMAEDGKIHDSACSWYTGKQSAATERTDADPCEKYADYLPDEVLCAYEHLVGLGTPAARYAYLYALWLDHGTNEGYPAGYTTPYQAYTGAYLAHQQAEGFEELICDCQDDSLQSLPSAPGAEDHAVDCPWYRSAIVSSLTITKSGMSEGESAIITVTNKNDAADTWMVAVGNGKAVTINGLTVGETYIISEDSAWAWRYDGASREVRIDADSAKNVVALTSAKTNDDWLSDENGVINTYMVTATTTTIVETEID